MTSELLGKFSTVFVCTAELHASAPSRASDNKTDKLCHVEETYVNGNKSICCSSAGGRRLSPSTAIYDSSL